MRREWFLHFLGLLNGRLFITIGKNLLFLLFSCFTVPMTLCRMHGFAQGHLSGGTPAPLKARLSVLVEGEALCSLRQVNVPNIHARAKQPDGKPSLARQRAEAQHLLCRGHIPAPDKSFLNVPVSSDLDLAKKSSNWTTKAPWTMLLNFTLR